MTPTPTSEGKHILDLLSGTENILINALAGTGKTTMLRIIDQTIGGEHEILYLVFNRRNADEAKEPDEDGYPKFNPSTEISTVNGACHKLWGTTASGRLTVNTKKTSDIFRNLVQSLSKEQQNEAWEDYAVIKQGVDMAKSLGYVPKNGGKFFPRCELCTEAEVYLRLDERPSQLAKDLINQILLTSIRNAYNGDIDFNDQVYMPAMFGASVPYIPLIMLDERQDFSPVNDEVCAMFVDKGARLIAVGDPWQSIYGFRGAEQDGMEKAKTRYDMIEADLSVSFRCPSEIVKAAQWRVPKLKWSREGGHATKLSSLRLDDICDGSAVICRNNAPLYSLALRLLASKRGVSLVGSELGPKVIGIMKKLGPEEMKQGMLLEEIEFWRGEKLAVQSTSANDTADCMRVFAGFGKTLGQALGYAEFMFKSRGPITLTTGHKAKGLEWGTVYHLDPWMIKSEEQELNLRYVVTTRSKDELFEVNSKEIT